MPPHKYMTIPLFRQTKRPKRLYIFSSLLFSPLIFSLTFSRNKQKTPENTKSRFFSFKKNAAAIFRGGVLGGAFNPLRTTDSKLEPLRGDHGGLFPANLHVHAQSLPSHTLRLRSNLILHSQPQQQQVDTN